MSIFISPPKIIFYKLSVWKFGKSAIKSTNATK